MEICVGIQVKIFRLLSQLVMIGHRELTRPTHYIKWSRAPLPFFPTTSSQLKTSNTRWSYLFTDDGRIKGLKDLGRCIPRTIQKTVVSHRVGRWAYCQ